MAVRLLLDTNRYSDLARGIQDVRSTIERADEVFLPFVVVAELRAGFAVGTRAKFNTEALAHFLKAPGVSVLYAYDGTTHQYAKLYYHLRKRGTPIPTNDLWIASLAVQHKLLLYARDAHFDELATIVDVI